MKLGLLAMLAVGVAHLGMTASAGEGAAAGGQEATERKRPWTFMVYGAADNSADEPLVGFLNKVRRAIDNDPGIELLLFIDRSVKHRRVPNYLGEDFTGARLYRLTKDKAERLAGDSQMPEITLDKDVEVDSANAKYVQQFIAWGKAHYPAERYGLMIYSHANGRSMCPDDQSHKEMGFAELTDKAGAQERVDFLGLELCDMGGIEIAYQWRPGNGGFETDVLLAIPNAGPPLDWDRAFARIRTPGHESRSGVALNPETMTAVDFGKLIIAEGHLGRQAAEKAGRGAEHESAGLYDLRRAEAVKTAVDALSVELAKADARDVVLELRGKGPKDAAMAYQPEGTNVDLYDLCRRIAACDRLPERVRERAEGVMTALEGFVVASFGMSGYKGFEGGKNGVYIVLPHDTRRFTQSSGWYTPLEGADKATGRLTFLRDGATPGNGSVENWFELLALWFGESGDGQRSRGYRP
jgi:clostripain